MGVNPSNPVFTAKLLSKLNTSVKLHISERLLEPGGFVMFEFGRIVGTPAVLSILTDKEVTYVLTRHAKGDWGEVSEANKKENDFSAKNGYRICSVYTVRGMKVHVITEADRSATTITFLNKCLTESGISNDYVFEDLKNKFYTIQELYEKEKDLKVKTFYKKRLLEIARRIGETFSRVQ